MHLMVSFLHMGNKDSDQARQWLRLSLVFAGSFFDLRKHFREICGLPHAFYNVSLSIPLSGVMILLSTVSHKWQVTMNTFELAHFGQPLKNKRTKNQPLPTCTKTRTCAQLGAASTGSLVPMVSQKSLRAG